MTRYVIIPTADVLQSHINMSLNKKIENVRTSVDGTKKLFEFDEINESFFSDYQWYDLNEILVVVNASEWTA
jgi:hypothetical protein